MPEDKTVKKQERETIVDSLDRIIEVYTVDDIERMKREIIILNNDNHTIVKVEKDDGVDWDFHRKNPGKIKSSTI